jgi:hypothetical protein
MTTRLNKILLIAGTTLMFGSIAGASPAMSPPTSHDDGHAPATKAAEPASKTAAPKTPASKTTAKPPVKKDDHGDSHDDEHADEHDDAHGEDHGESAVGKSASKDRKAAEPRKPLFGDKATDDKNADEKKEDVSVNADSALSMLKEGNVRWVSGDVKNPSTDSARRQLTSDKGQKPFARPHLRRFASPRRARL